MPEPAPTTEKKDGILLGISQTEHLEAGLPIDGLNLVLATCPKYTM